MGEYYNWVNVDRKEYICPSDFDMGNKLLESSAPHYEFLCSLRELIANEWSGSHILFLGDSRPLSLDENNVTIKKLYDQTVESGHEGNGFDTVFETYKNISGWFSGAEKDVRREIEFYLREVEIGESDAFNEYGVDPEDPYKGLFARKGTDFRYTLNHTKKVYYSPDEIKVILLSNGKTEVPDKKPGGLFSKPAKTGPSIDPLPYLLRYGYWGTGEWVGDIIGVSDTIPEGYALLTEITIDY